MKILFAGTPDYAVPSLQALAGLAPAHPLVGVVTQPDRAKGRSRTPSPTPVKAAALALGIAPERIYQPRSINEAGVLEALRALAPDLFCVVAYGNILKQDALGLARLYPLNAHGSLLPRHRGAAPIQAALWAGDRESGVSIMKMEAGLDTGPVLLRRAVVLEPRETAGSLHDKLAALSAACFLEALELIGAGRERFVPQDPAAASYAPKLEKDSGRIDWSQPAAAIERQIRALSPWPGCWVRISAPREGAPSLRVRLVEAECAAFPGQAHAGGSEPGGAAGWASGVGDAEQAAGAVGLARVFLRDPAQVARPEYAKAFWVCCGEGSGLLVTEVQPEGKRPMGISAFLAGAGRAFQEGARLG